MMKNTPTRQPALKTGPDKVLAWCRVSLAHPTAIGRQRESPRFEEAPQTSDTSRGFTRNGRRALLAICRFQESKYKWLANGMAWS